MGRELESFVENVGSLDISHQEIDRILKTVEEMYSETKANAPDMEWMPVDAVGNLICFELGCAAHPSNSYQRMPACLHPDVQDSMLPSCCANVARRPRLLARVH